MKFVDFNLIWNIMDLLLGTNNGTMSPGEEVRRNLSLLSIFKKVKRSSVINELINEGQRSLFIQGHTRNKTPWGHIVIGK